MRTDATRVTSQDGKRKESSEMLWLILGIILLVIAIAGGAIVHPILFVLGIVAIAMFLMHRRAAY